MQRVILCAAFLLAGMAASAATVQLKDKASVSGTILAEKQNEVVIDIGYTVLVIPRNQILSLMKDGSATPSPLSSRPMPTAPIVVAPPAEPVATAPVTLPRVGSTVDETFYHSGTVGLKERTVLELAAELGSAVVQVRTPEGLGSGFFINDDGYLITNFHVTEGETQISVEVFQKKSGKTELERNVYKQVRIVALNKFGDLALLKVDDKDAPKFAHVTLGDADALAVGERVFAIGSPLGLERSVTEGIVSTKTRQLQGDLYLQTTAQINPGNSGGPLFNMRGEVVGVTNMKITSGEGLGFAIPVEAVIYFLKHRDSFAYDNGNPSNPYRYLPPVSREKNVSSD
jgi:serine protease Do